MKNVMNYENAIAQAAATAANLAELARIDLDKELPIATGVDGKKGAKVIQFAGGSMDLWLAGYCELAADGNAKAAKVIVATLNSASAEVFKDEPSFGRVSIQKVNGEYVFVMQPPKAKTEEEVSPLVEAAKELAKTLTPEQEEKLAALLNEAAQTI